MCFSYLYKYIKTLCVIVVCFVRVGEYVIAQKIIGTKSMIFYAIYATQF